MESLDFVVVCQEVGVMVANVTIIASIIRTSPLRPTPQDIVLPGDKNKKKKAKRGKEFFNSTYHPQNLMSSSVVIDYGKDILQNTDVTSNWALYSELESRVAVVAQHMILRGGIWLQFKTSLRRLLGIPECQL
ncbi:hypothetical protein GYH30_015991 [Glycine max]|nr:hypothetical protein GYH30_015991 [Glycine max]